VVRPAHPAWPVTYPSAAEDRLATLAGLGVRHHTAPVRRLLRKYPGLRLVIAHLGAPDSDDFVALAEQHPGTWLA